MTKKSKKISCLNVKDSKIPRLGPQNSGGNHKNLQHRLVWQFSLLDIEHEKWGWRNLKHSVAQELLSKLKGFESMTWSEILLNKKHHHSVAITDLVKSARDRLEELNMDDTDELFRLRLNGKQRLWGLREGYVLKVIWWGPDHSVCESSKKHT